MRYIKKLFESLFKRKVRDTKINNSNIIALEDISYERYLAYTVDGAFVILPEDNICFEDFTKVEVKSPTDGYDICTYLNNTIKFHEVRHEAILGFFRQRNNSITVVLKNGEVISNYEKYGETLIEDYTLANLNLLEDGDSI